MRLLIAAAATLVGMATTFIAPAAANEDDLCPRGVCVGTGGGAIQVGDVVDRPGGRLALSEPSPTHEWRLVNTCEREDDPLGGCTTQPPCPGPPDRVIGRFLVQFRLLADPPGTDWTDDGIHCVDVTELQPTVTPAMVQSEFEELPLPLGEISVQPSDGVVLVNLGAILYTTQPDTAAYDIEILDQAVRIDAFIVDYAWQLGDGSPDIYGRGGPYPDESTRHVYTTAGGVQVTLTLTWDATYTVDGGPVTPVLDTTTTQSPPTPLTVVEAESILVESFD